jgi:uncharacterized protein (DUF736 family)
MAQALGYVTKNEIGNFAGTLTLGGISRINIVANDNKESKKQPDFRIVDSRGQEIGGGWLKTGEVSGKEYLSLTFAHPTLGPRKVYANLGQAYGKNADDFAILWNPQED